MKICKKFKFTRALLRRIRRGSSAIFCAIFLEEAIYISDGILYVDVVYI